MSIRLESGGHSFSEEQLSQALASGEGVEVEIITPRTTLMPAEARLAPAEVLRMAGLAPLATECAVESVAVDGRVAVMAVDSALCARFSGRSVDYLSPLASVYCLREGVMLNLIGSVLYLHIVEGGVLRVAEALPVATDADILYYLERFNQVYLIYNRAVYIKGDDRLVPIVRRVFKSVICE
ncbi:MAG: hypothetical protein IJE06_01385 [Alistipes sp.]|nr:hypothetical protein [Alistipes sp.]